jgi:hypothetical protein
MKHLTAFFCLIVLLAAPGAFAAPSIKVTVFDAAGKPAFQGATGGEGTFATGALNPGRYIVQFNAKAAGVTGQNYALIISSGKKKVVADSVAGEKFTGGGVAMRIEVGSGSKITGHITDAVMTRVDENGNKLVWIPQRLGSHLPAHWAAADSADAKLVLASTSLSFKNLQDKQAQGIGLR